MSKELTKDDVILHKKKAIKALNKMLEYFINSSNPKHLKKANLLSYWFEIFSNYILNEENYSPLRQISYKRGNVIKANFGFNVGKEYGGLHYAVVIDKQNDHHSHVITVVPLTSGTADNTHKKDVYLGTELYSKLRDKHSSILNESQEKLNDLEKITSSLNEALTLIQQLSQKKLEANNSNENAEYADELSKKYKEVSDMKNEKQKTYEQLESDIEFIKKSKLELDKLKVGSIALVEQITTIDKSRIYTPRKSRDVLYGISFSDEKMELINEALKKLYIF